MCKDCGCSAGGPVQINGQPMNPPTDPGHGHGHPQAPLAHAHGQGEAIAPHHVEVHQSLLEKNDRYAERNRGFFQAKKWLVLNMLSSPGSGKTTLVQKTAEHLRGRLRVGVIVGDLATDNDAARLRAAGIPVVQITTGTLCHLEAEMVGRALSQLESTPLDILIIENVGNLVCPAAYDLGEHLRAVLLSVTEGEDKPLKYPPVFHSAHAALVTKMDLAEATAFDRERALANLRRISHHARVFELSARTGQGMEEWCDFLTQQHQSLGRGNG
ncbi:MAG: hydrogenase nickel incorporation protein HypB [Verrucomicrobiae bacterium]|nr:hydrogenase nickel incorporation protein HypB [Verrucomicrobiae bacterium]